MKCPYCGHSEDKVMDTRPTDDGSKIRRRRECLSCQKRFTTYEAVDTLIMVVKKDRTRQPFDRDKLLGGIMRACVKLPVPMEQIQALVDDIESSVANLYVHEVSAMEIGEMVLKRLKNVNLVAYIRFASVYREFTDIRSFMQELERLEQEADTTDA